MWKRQSKGLGNHGKSQGAQRGEQLVGPVIAAEVLGEAGGVLDVILQRLADFLEKAQKLKRKIIGAMIYPAAVITVAVLIVTGIMYFVIPKFKEIFNDFEVELPALTLWLTDASAWVAGNASPNQAIPGAVWILIAPVVIFLTLKLIRMTGPGRATTDVIRVRIPIVGNLLRKTAVARFTRTLGTMLSSGVPILDALDIVARSAGNRRGESAGTPTVMGGPIGVKARPMPSAPPMSMASTTMSLRRGLTGTSGMTAASRISMLFTSC